MSKKETRQEVKRAKEAYKEAKSRLKDAERRHKQVEESLWGLPKARTKLEKRYYGTKKVVRRQTSRKELYKLKKRKDIAKKRKKAAIQRNGGTKFQKVKRVSHRQASHAIDDVFQDNDVLEDIAKGRQKIRRTHVEIRTAKRVGNYAVNIGKGATRNVYGGANRTYNLIRGRGFTRTAVQYRWETKVTTKYERLRRRLRVSKLGKGVRGIKKAGGFISKPLLAVLKNPLSVKAYLILFAFFLGIALLGAIAGGGSSTVSQNEFDLTDAWTHLSKIDREKSTDEVDYWTNIDDIMLFMGYKYRDYKLNAPYNAKNKGLFDPLLPYRSLLTDVWNEMNGNKDHLKTMETVYTETDNQYLKLTKEEKEEYHKLLEQANKVGYYIAYLELRNPFTNTDLLDPILITKRFGYISKDDLYTGTVLKANKETTLYAVMGGQVEVKDGNLTIQSSTARFTYNNVTNVKVESGTTVKVGEEIASVGSDDGQEVIYEKLKQNKDWVRVNPGFYFPTVEYNQTTSVLSNFNFEGDIAKKISEIYNYLKKQDPEVTINGVAAMLGNFWTESYITAKRAEGDYLPPPVGAAEHLWDDPGWLSIGGPAIYNGRYPNILKRGLGLGQWTDTADGSNRHTALREYSKSKNKKWYDLDLQIDFMLHGDSPYYIQILKDVLHSNEDVSSLTNTFLVRWEGNPGDKLKERQHNAHQVLAFLKNPRGSARGTSNTLQSSWAFPSQYSTKLTSYPSASTVKASLDSNTYPVGQCTWYVYNRLVDAGVPRYNWLGNGQDWVRNLVAKGWTFSDTPVAGAVMSTRGGFDHTSVEYGHVSYVEYVNEDGTFLVSECNWAGVQDQIHWAEKTNASYFTFAIPPQ